MSEQEKIKGPDTNDELLVSKIFIIREQKVMLDSDLADLYGVETFRLNEQVKRNINRFPKDFMFQLSKQEWESLISQNAISKKSRGGRRTAPYVFTEHGVLMLSSVLNSDKAIQVNIQIMRIFTRIRQMVIDNTELWKEIADIRVELTKKARDQDSQNKNIDLIFDYIDRLQEKIEESPTLPERNRIGYEIGGKK